MSTASDALVVNGNRPDLSVAVRTLVTGGFVLDGAHRNPGYAILHMHRADEFGAAHSYAFAVAEDRFTSAQIAAAHIAARRLGAHLVLVGEAANSTDVPLLDWDRLVNLFGGPVFSTSPLEPEFAAQLSTLGENRLPAGLSGRPDDLFEIYVQVALEFVLGGRVVRYGQDRRFEARPDGIALPRQNFRALYDAKAYSGEGYPVSAESIRQFKSYVEDFSRRYGAFMPRLNAFIVVSARFVQGDDALADRSRELQAECGTPLIFLRSADLGEMITIVAERPAVRAAIDWRRVFADPVVSLSRVRREVAAVLRDKIIPST